MDLRHGIDLVECDRIYDLMDRHGDRFVKRILTEAEQARVARYKDTTEFVAGRWAAKEAVLKMLGTGWRGRVAWRDIEILPDEWGQPHVTLYEESAHIAEKLGIGRIRISITHTTEYAMASVIGLIDDGKQEMAGGLQSHATSE